MTEVRRIAILLMSLEGGGAQRRVVDLANGFVRRGRDVELFLLDSNGKLRGRLDPRVRLADAATLADRLRADPPEAFLSGAAAIHSIAVRSVPPERSFPLVLRASSHPYRNIPVSMPRQWLGERMRRAKRMKAYAAADLIIAVNEAVAAPLRAAFPGKFIEAIHNLVVTDEFIRGASATIDYPWSDEPGIPLILAIGRLAFAKDFPTLLRAFALVRRQRPARLAVLGSGSDARRSSLLGLATKLGIERDFALIDDSNHVAAWLSRARLLVSSSLWEGAPAVIIEALAMGCPVVATDSIGAAREILADPELGSLVPPRRPTEMAKAIARWLDRTVDQERLRAATAAYRIDASDEYLRAIDESAQHMRANSRA